MAELDGEACRHDLRIGLRNSTEEESKLEDIRSKLSDIETWLDEERSKLSS